MIAFAFDSPIPGKVNNSSNDAVLILTSFDSPILSVISSLIQPSFWIFGHIHSFSTVLITVLTILEFFTSSLVYIIIIHTIIVQ